MDNSIFLALNGSSSLWCDLFALIITSPYLWIPLYFSIIYMIVKNAERPSIAFFAIIGALMCVALSGLLNDFYIKPWVQRLRPCYEPALQNIVDLAEKPKESLYGFFSSHAANYMAITIFISLLVKNVKLFFSLFIWTLVNSWTRIYLGYHYPSDVLFGMFWGMLVAFIVYAVFRLLFTRMASKTYYQSGRYTSSGYSFTDINIVVIVLMLTFFAAIIIANIYS